MNTQKIFAFLLTAFLLSLTLVSAATFNLPTVSTTDSLTVNATSLNSTATTITLEGTSSVLPTFSIANYILTTNIPASTYTSLILGKTYSGSINASNVYKNESQIIPVTIMKTYCSNGTTTNTTRYLELISVKDTSSDTDFEWKPADSVSLAVKVKYTNTADSSDTLDAIIKVELYDTQTHQFVDFDNSNSDDLERSVSLDEGSTSTEDFTLDVPTSDLDDSSDRYVLYVKVYEDGSENRLCADKSPTTSVRTNEYSQPIRIQKNSYDVILKNTELAATSVPCGQEVTINTQAINTGNNDETKVYVTAFNKEMGVNLTSSVFTLDQGDTNKLSFSFTIPVNASQNTHVIYLTTHYKYSKSSDEYRETSDAYLTDLKVENCIPPVTATITAGFNAETPKAVIGNQVIIESTVKNTGTSAASYTMAVSGNSAWSTLAEIDPKTFTLNAGEEKKVNIYLDINSNAVAGDQTFTITTTSGTYTTQKTVQLALEKGLTSQAIVQNMKQYWYVYVIGLIILILLIAIIVAIVRLTKK